MTLQFYHNNNDNTELEQSLLTSNLLPLRITR